MNRRKRLVLMLVVVHALVMMGFLLLPRAVVDTYRELVLMGVFLFGSTILLLVWLAVISNGFKERR